MVSIFLTFLKYTLILWSFRAYLVVLIFLFVGYLGLESNPGRQDGNLMSNQLKLPDSPIFIFYLYIYKNGRTDVCPFVCLSVGMWRAHGNPNPYTDLNKILHAPPHPSKEGFGAVLTPATLPPGSGGLKLLKLKTYFWKLFTIQKMFSGSQVNPGSAGYLS